MLQKGFTLIELMIVVAIIGILSMFALPAYQDYTKRTYVSEGMALATAAKMSTTEQFATAGTWPGTNLAAGLPAANQITGQAVSGVGLTLGNYADPAGTNKAGVPGVAPNPVTATNIVIVYNSKVVSSTTAGIVPAQTDVGTAQAEGTNTLTIAPVLKAAGAGSVQWECLKRGTALEAKWLPSTCRDRVS